MTANLPLALHEEFTDLSNQLGRSRSMILADMVRAFVDAHRGGGTQNPIDLMDATRTQMQQEWTHAMGQLIAAAINIPQTPQEAVQLALQLQDYVRPRE